MRMLTISLVVLSTFSFPAFAESRYNWTGLYLGANVGWTLAHTVGYDSQPLLDTTSQSFSGANIGGQVGYRHQFLRTIVGMEAAANWSGAEGSENCYSHLPGGMQASCATKQPWDVRWLTQLGYSFGDGRWLPYFTGGIALSKMSIETNITQGATVQTRSAQSNLVGVVLGGGIEWAANRQLSLGVQYLHTAFADQDFSSMGFGYVNGVQNFRFRSHANQDLRTDVIRLTLNIKID